MRLALRPPFRGLLLGIGALCCLPAMATQEVRVGGAHFPPYVIKPSAEVLGGLLPQLLEALNQIQADFHFVMLPTSVQRRFRDFEQGRIDIALFENPEWGWQKIEHQVVDMALEDAEVFVGRAEAGHGQEYFEQLKGKRLALYSGYHYSFAAFNADPKFLAREFSATLTYSHDSNLLMVLKNRADIALVTRSYLGDFFEQHRDYQARLLVSERVDQRYRHHALLRPRSPIDGPAFAALLRRLRDNGRLQKIFSPYQIEVLPGAAVVTKAATTP
ncbi:MAG: transporter substrate-binding domain-containing protein [Pseudomonas sp.]|uniref:substrate-binding periplasmic protein n=1 Tax=Pseudomonas sp. TaxID=306 RepID=UPI0033991682